SALPVPGCTRWIGPSSSTSFLKRRTGRSCGSGIRRRSCESPFPPDAQSHRLDTRVSPAHGPVHRGREGGLRRMALDLAVEGIAAETIVDDDAGARPTARLPLRQLFQLSVYWFGINSIMGGLGVVVQKQVPVFVPAPWDAVATAIQSILTMLMAAAIQPTIG